MTPGKPKMNAPGQKIAAAQEIRMMVRPGLFGIRIPIIIFQARFSSVIFV
jgi:hypothetical protein